MRTLLLAALATAASIPTSADACGPYGFRPRVFMVSSHGVHDGADGWSTRTFVQIGGEIPADTKLAMLAPGTYDGTRIADATDLDYDMTFTLVGPTTTRVVESRARVFLAPAWQGAKGEALEVTSSALEPQIALAGRHTDAKWIALDWKTPTKHDTMTFGENVSISQLHGTNTRIVTRYRDGKSFSVLRPSTRIAQDVEGSPLGAFTVDGKQYLVTTANGRAITTQL
jgi:hypothetical protein